MKSFKLTLEISNNTVGSPEISISNVREEQAVIIFKNGRRGDHTPKVKTLDIKNINFKDKTIYRYPKLALPRNKVDVLKEKYNVSVIRNPDAADYKVISIDYVNSLLSKKWTDSIMLNDFISKYEETKSHWNQASVDLAISRIKQSIKEDEKVCVSLDKRISWSYSGTSTYDVLNEFTEDSGTSYFISDPEGFLSVVNSTNLIFDTDLCGVTVEDSVILKESDYENLLKMITSNDKENVNLALEVMANCNVEKSFDVIALLFYMHHNTLKDSSTIWTSVNVKTLRKRFSEFIPYGNYNVHFFDRLIKNLVQEKQLTEFAFKIISVEVLKYMTSVVGFSKESVFDITIEDIKLKDDFKSKMIENKDGVKVIDHQTYLPF